MPITEPSPGRDPRGLQFGNVAGSVNLSAQGDIVGGNKITHVTTVISVEAITQRPLITTSPYRGLERFEARNEHLFFGRDQLIKTLTAQLEKSNILLVLGASGSGKSSVVRAGLLPKLSKAKGSPFRDFTFVPDKNPFLSFGSALQSGGFTQTQTRELQAGTPDTPAKLIRLLQRPNEEWLLFVDQFEEIFTVSDEPTRRAFIAALVGIARDNAGSTKVVLAMRADFPDRFSPFPEFAELVGKNISFVTDMQLDELRQAIEQPAAAHGMVFEPGLVEEIIKDVQGQAGSLPLLQYTLDLLWEDERRSGGLNDRHLNTKLYRELGGVRGALQKRANEFYARYGEAKAASPTQEIVRQIFLRLVDLAGETANEAAWRPVRRRAPKAGFGKEVEQEVLQALINEKLIVSNREQDGTEVTVEVAHEALFTSWERLKKWIDGGKQVIFVKNRLADDARRWHRRRSEDGVGAEEELLSGTRLGQAMEMRARGDFITIFGGLSETETQFLDSSAALRDRRKQEEHDRHQQELRAKEELLRSETERREHAEIARRRGRRITLLSIAFGLVSIVLAAGAYLSWHASQRLVHDASQSDFANAQARLAEGKWQEAVAYLGRSLRYDAKNLRARDALWLALVYGSRDAGLRPLHVVKSMGKVNSASFSPDSARFVIASDDQTAEVWDAVTWKKVGSTMVHDDAVRTANFSPDSKRVVTVSSDKTAQVWDAETGLPVGDRMRHQGEVLVANFSPDSRRVVTASVDKSARVWDAATGRPVGLPMQAEKWMLDACFSPDGKRVLTASKNGTAQVWDVDTGRHVGDPMKHGDAINTASFSRNGQRVVTASADNTAQVWDAETGRRVGDPMEHKDAVNSASFNPDGTQVVTASSDNTARMWDAVTGQFVGDPRTHQDAVNTASFSRDGSRVVTASSDKTARIWDTVTRQPIGSSLQHDGEVNDASFSPDGSHIVTASSDLTARVWGVTPLQSVGAPLPHNYEVNSVSFSPDGRFVVTASSDKTAQVWNAVTGLPIGDRMKHQAEVNGASFSTDSKRVVTASSDKTAQVWDAFTGRPVGKPMEHDDAVLSAGFSRNGTRVVTAGRDTIAQIWDTATGQRVGKPMKHNDAVCAASFSPDGTHVVTASVDQTARVWDAVDGKPVGDPMKHKGPVLSASFNSNGTHVVTASDDQTAQVWDAVTGRSVGVAMMHQGAINSACFSPDGTRVVTASQDRTAQVWDAVTGRHFSSSKGRWTQSMVHQDAVLSASFSPDGTRVVTASSDRAARVWEAATGQPVGIPLRHQEAVLSASFSPDGRRIVTASRDRTARVWDIGTDERPDPKSVENLAVLCSGMMLDPELGTLRVVSEEQRRLLWEKIEPALARYPEWLFVAKSFSPRSPKSPVSPHSQLTLREAATRLIQTRFEGGAREARSFDPGNPLLPIAGFPK